MEPNEDKTTDGMTADAKLIADAKMWYQQCTEYLNSWITQAKEDINFFCGEHWAPEVLDARRRDKRPSMTIDRTSPTINRILNEFRQNRPGPIVSGKDAQSSAKTAELVEGMIRHIAYNSDAESAFDTASLYQLICGKGFIRLQTDYEDDSSFDQCIKYMQVEDPLSVLIPEWRCTKPGFIDMPYCFILHAIDKDEFKETYPNAKSSTSWCGTTTQSGMPAQKEVMLVELYVKENTTKTLYKVKFGELIGTTDDKSKIPEGAEVIESRTVTESKIKWYMLNDVEVLDSTDWLGDCVPVVCIASQRVLNQGKPVYSSKIKDMREPQKEYNWGKSAQVESVAMAPLPPFVAAEGQIANHREDWRDSATKHIAVLEYDPVDIMGHPVPPPQRQSGAQVNPGVSELVMGASEDIKATSGVYDANLAVAGKETAGVAIDARQNQSDQCNFHYYDNICKGACALYQMTLDLIPKIYDSHRIVRILGEDESEDVAFVNAHYATENKNKNGEVYNLSAGKYDVIVKTGPSFSTKKEKVSELMQNLVKAYPQSMPALALPIAQMNDAPQMVLDVLRAIQPPQLNQNSKDGNPADKALIQQLDSVIGKLQQEIGQLQQRLNSKMDVENAKTQREIIKGQIEIKRALIEMESAMKLKNVDQAHDVGLQAHKHHLEQIAADNGLIRQSKQPQPAQPAAVQGA